MRAVNYTAKAEHFAELAARAAYRAATCPEGPDADAWADRAARYDMQADDYRNAARKAV